MDVGYLHTAFAQPILLPMFYINYNDAAGIKPRYKIRSLEPHEQPSDTGTTMALPASKPLDSVAKNKSQSGE